MERCKVWPLAAIGFGLQAPYHAVLCLFDGECRALCHTNTRCEEIAADEQDDTGLGIAAIVKA